MHSIKVLSFLLNLDFYNCLQASWGLMEPPSCLCLPCSTWHHSYPKESGLGSQGMRPHLSFPLCPPVTLDLFQLNAPCSLLSLGPPKCNFFCWRSFFLFFSWQNSTNLSSVSMRWLFQRRISWSSKLSKDPILYFHCILYFSFAEFFTLVITWLIEIIHLIFVFIARL